MRNLLPRVLWDYIIGVIVGVIAVLVTLVVVGLVSRGVPRTGELYAMLSGGLVPIGFVTLLGVLLVVTLYEATVLFQARGKMMEPGATESRLLTREVIIRALISGAVAGIYTALITLAFALLAHEAADLNLPMVLLLGLLLSVMVIASGALAYAFVGTAIRDVQGELNSREWITLLALPLALAVLFGLLFGAAAGNAEGVISAVVAALLTYGLVRGLESLRWRVLQRSLAKLLRARGGPTIKVVSTHRA